MTTHILELKIKPFGFPIAFEITNIIIRAMTSDENGAATVNGIEVEECYANIIHLLNSHQKVYIR